jgi:hypothetical protein
MLVTIGTYNERSYELGPCNYPSEEGLEEFMTLGQCTKRKNLEDSLGDTRRLNLSVLTSSSFMSSLV